MLHNLRIILFVVLISLFSIACENQLNQDQLSPTVNSLPKPILEPTAGTYSQPQEVTFKDQNVSAELLYAMVDEDYPISSELIFQKYTSPINVTGNQTIKAFYTQDGIGDSPIISGSYSITHAGTPLFSLDSGNYPTPKTLQMTTNTPNAQIYYTTDGTLPSNDSLKYSNSILVDHSMSVRAIALRDNLLESPVASADYTIPLVSSVQEMEISSRTLPRNQWGAAVEWQGEILTDGGIYVWENNVLNHQYSTNTPPNAEHREYDGSILAEIVRDSISSTRYDINLYETQGLSNRTLVSTIQGAEVLWDIELYQNYLYVATDTNGLCIYDITTPSNPILINKTGYRAGHIEIMGNILAMAGAHTYEDGEGVALYDLSDPAAPSYLATENSVASSAGIWGMTSNETSLYIATSIGRGASNLYTVDISVPSTPQVTKNIRVPSLTYSGIVYDSGYVYLPLTETHWVEVFDVTTPLNPVSLGYIDTGNGFGNTLSGRPLAFNGYFATRGLDGVYLYGVNDNNTLTIQQFLPNIGHGEIAVNSNSVFVNLTSCTEEISEANFTKVKRTTLSRTSLSELIVSENYAFATGHIYKMNSNIVDSERGFFVFDISTPTEPRRMVHIQSQTYPRSLEIFADTAVFVDDYYFYIIDISDPNYPTILGTVSHASNPGGLAFNGTTAYLTTTDGLKVIDCSVYSTPSVVTTISGYSKGDASIVGGTLFVGHDYVNGTVTAFDISDSQNPMSLGSYIPENYESNGNQYQELLPYGAQNVVVSHQTATEILDVSNPEAIERAKLFSIPLADMDLYDGRLYLAGNGIVTYAE